MKYCKYCGNQLHEGAEYCTNCGKLIKQEIKKPTNKKSKGFLAVAIIISAILGIIIFAIVIFCLSFSLIIGIVEDELPGNNARDNTDYKFEEKKEPVYYEKDSIITEKNIEMQIKNVTREESKTNSSYDNVSITLNLKNLEAKNKIFVTGLFKIVENPGTINENVKEVNGNKFTTDILPAGKDYTKELLFKVEKSSTIMLEFYDSVYDKSPIFRVYLEDTTI